MTQGSVEGWQVHRRQASAVGALLVCLGAAACGPGVIDVAATETPDSAEAEINCRRFPSRCHLPDAGSSWVDAGSAAPDASVGVIDAGTSAVDGGVTRADSGTPLTDAGASVADAGAPVVDAGLPPTDAGGAVIDAGAPVVDAGTPPNDAGVPADQLGSALPPLLGPSPGTALYVATTGSDSNAGTLEAPLRTIQRGIRQAQPGQTIYVRGGTYAESAAIETNASSPVGRPGTAANPTTLRAYPGEVVTWHGNGSYLLRLSYGTRYWRVQGFRFEADTGLPAIAGKGNYMAVWVSDSPGTDGLSANHIEFSGNEFDGRSRNNTAFLVSPKTNAVHIIGNRFHHWGDNSEQRQGLYHQGQNGLIMNNIVHNLPQGFGIQVRGDDGSNRAVGTIVTNNTCVEIGLSGIVVEDTAYNVRVVNNISAFNTQSGVYGYNQFSLNPGSLNRAFKNVVFNNGNSAQMSNSSGTVIDFSNGAGTWVGPGDNATGDPRFESRLTNNYRPTAGSSAIGYGLAEYTPPFDFDGQPRTRQGAGAIRE